MRENQRREEVDVQKEELYISFQIHFFFSTKNTADFLVVSTFPLELRGPQFKNTCFKSNNSIDALVLSTTVYGISSVSVSTQHKSVPVICSHND